MAIYMGYEGKTQCIPMWMMWAKTKKVTLILIALMLRKTLSGLAIQYGVIP